MMKIVPIFYLISNFLIHSKSKLIEVKAKYDPQSNTLRYNGQIYTISMISNNSFPDLNNYEIISLNSREEKGDSFFDGFWFNFIGFSILACFAGAMSGLTVGYLSIDMLILEIKMSKGTQKEKEYAKKIKKIINDHHWILVTLLLCNAFACEAMPILLDKLVSDIMAIVVSVTVLLFVGEIVPQALCTGPNQMKIAAFLAPFTYALMVITYPLSFPIAKFMDLVVGKHGKTRFCNSDLKGLIELHLKEYKGNINTQQIEYFTGYLDIINTKVNELMVPMEKVYKLDYNYNLNHNSLKQIINTGYSRIPIYENEPNNLIGVLLLKDLLGKDLSHPINLNELNINIINVIYVSEETYFLDLLEQFQNGKSKMAFVYKEISKEEKLLPDYRITVNDSNNSEIIDTKTNDIEKIIIKENIAINESESEDKIDGEEPLLPNNDNEEKKEDEVINEEKNEKKEKEKIMIDDIITIDQFENKDRKIIGIITLEDLVESLLKIHFNEEREVIRKSIRKATI